MFRRPAMLATVMFLWMTIFLTGSQAQVKPSSDVLLPYFEIGLEGSSATTVFAVANALDKPVDATLTIYTNWGIPVLSTPVKFKAREIWTANLRDWLIKGTLSGKGQIPAGQLDGLRAELAGVASPDDGLYYSTSVAPGRAAGYITIRTVRTAKSKKGGGKNGRPDALRGEVFLVDPEQGPARGQDLIDVDPTTTTRVCFNQGVHHRSGAGVGDARLVLWRDMANQILPIPVAGDRTRQVDVSIYSAAGKLVRTNQIRLQPVEDVTLSRLGLTEPLGFIEIATTDPSVVGVLTSEDGPVVDASCTQSTPGGNQPQIHIRTLVNGQDANAAPGPKIPVSAPIEWQYELVNVGSGALSQVKIVDEEGTAVSCPKTTLAQGQTMTCVGRSVAKVCQQRTVGTVTAAAGGKGKKPTTVSAQDPANYFGDEGAALEIVVSTNGQDANDPEGPHLQAGARVDWSYQVKNTGKLRLYELAVKDDHNVAVDCPRVSLAPGESMTCAANGIVVPGQYRNVGTATARGTCGPITDDDVSHYFGESETSLQVRVLTNGYDGDFPPGPSIPVDSKVAWEYIVTNTGKLDVAGLQAGNDRNIAASCPATTLASGRSITCRAQGVAAACQQSHTATVSGHTSEGQPVSASDQSNYYGTFQAGIGIKTLVNGSDADQPPGPSIVIGGAVQWSYMVTNTGKVALTGVQVTDDKGAAVVCPKAELRPGEVMTCKAGGTAVSGDFRNVGTVTALPPCGTPVTASDPSHYRGAGDPGVRIQTRTNSQDANVPPGPSVPVGAPVRWDYVVTNTGQLGLSTIAVTDSRGVGVTCPKTTLKTGESMTCVAEGTARACQYDNLGTVTARTPDDRPITAVDPSYYYGQPNADVRIQTATNGVDANSEPGPTIRVGSAVTWTYTVTNGGNVDLADVQVVDDQGAAVSCPKTTLPSGETMTCTARGTAVEGQYGNTGTVSASPPCGPRLTARDASHYFGSGNGALDIQTFVNNQDANEPPGPTIAVGAPITWTYRVTNSGVVSLSGIAVTDSRGVAVICPKSTLDPAGEMTCTASGRAQACQYDNLGTATGRTVDGQQVNAVDPSYYFGNPNAAVSFEAKINSQDAGSPPGPTLPAGSLASWTYIVANRGDVALGNVRVSDQSGGPVSCPKSVLQPGELMTCTATGLVVEGSVSNQATVKADPPCGTQVTAQDTTWYNGGGAPGLLIRKFLNGQEVLKAPGPTLAVGSTILWTYAVTNTGQVKITQIVVTDDDPALTVACPKSDLDAGQSMTCTARGVAVPCQYGNLATAAGWAATSQPGQPVAALAASWYYGEPQPGVRLLAATNGYQADAAPGPIVIPGSGVTWTYTVINTGNVDLAGILVTDSQGPTVSCPRTTLQADASMVCAATGQAFQGQYENVGSVTATPACGARVSAQDPSHYFGGGDAGIAIETLVNGQAYSSPPGLQVTAGQSVTWTYRVTNTGQVPLSGVTASDSRGITVVCPKATLQPAETLSCTGSGKIPACQYDNLGVATGASASGQQVSSIDASYAFGRILPAVTLETRVNGQDADQAPGPTLQVGSTLTWVYVVRNSGDSALANVRIDDDLVGVVSCPKTALQAGEQMTCYAFGTATEGAHDTRGTVTADPPCGTQVQAGDDTHYFGGGLSGLQIRKLTNGQDLPWPGATIPVNQPVVWTYAVTNSGLLPLTSLAVTDDDPSITVTCPKTALQPNETITCTSGPGTARACGYVNIGKATAQSSSGVVSASDPSFYQGSFQAAIQIETRVDGKDADTAPGPYIQSNTPVTWTYLVTNLSTVPLTGVQVRDDQGAAVTCPGSTLQPNQSMTCSASGLAAAGQFVNTGIATANPPCGAQISAQDPSYYFGMLPASVDIQKLTNGKDVAQPSDLVIPTGSAVTWKYIVTNTGQAQLTGISVSDDRGVAVSCPKTALLAGEIMTCTGSGTAIGGDYSNTGRVFAQTPYSTTVNDSDVSYYRGVSASIVIETTTNGQEDDDPSSGVPVVFGTTFQRSYTVTNTGLVDLINVQVSDSGGLAVSCNGVTSLPAGASMTCTATSIATCGLHTATSTATATTTSGQAASDSDPNTYRATEAPSILVKTFLNSADADDPTLAAQVNINTTVSVRHTVTNTGNVTLQGINLTDEKSTVGGCAPPSTLAPGASFTCNTSFPSGSSIQRSHDHGTVTAQSACGTVVSDSDPAHYVTCLAGFCAS